MWLHALLLQCAAPACEWLHALSLQCVTPACERWAHPVATGCYTSTWVTRTPAVTKALRQHLSDMHTYLYNDITPECEWHVHQPLQRRYFSMWVTSTSTVTTALRQHLSDMYTYLYNDVTPECEWHVHQPLQRRYVSIGQRRYASMWVTCTPIFTMMLHQNVSDTYTYLYNVVMSACECHTHLPLDLYCTFVPFVFAPTVTTM